MGEEGSGGIEIKREKFMDTDNSVVISEGMEMRRGGGGYRVDKW